jgi:hypothetical protein
MPSSPLDMDLDRQITTTHDRFVAAMTARLPSMGLETKERYFGLLSTLVAKLEIEDKSLREVLQETMTDAANVILLELAR